MDKTFLTREIGDKILPSAIACLASGLRRVDSHPRAQMLTGDSSVRQPLTSAFPTPSFFCFFVFHPPTSGWCINEEIRRKRKQEKAMQKVHVFENVPGGGKVICAPQQTCGGTANQGARCPTDLVVARLPRVAEALTHLRQGALWRFNGFPDPVGKVQSPALSNGFPVSFFEHFHRPPIHPIFKGPCPES
jgi:hypothetical protein